MWNMSKVLTLKALANADSNWRELGSAAAADPIFPCKSMCITQVSYCHSCDGVHTRVSALGRARCRFHADVD